MSEIGKCIGCDKSPRRLDKGVCQECLEHPKRGRKWAEMAHRIRNEPDFALKSFNEIGVTKPERELAGKLLFIRMFGLPQGAVCPPELKKLLESTPEEPEDPQPRLRLVR